MTALWLRDQIAAQHIGHYANHLGAFFDSLATLKATHGAFVEMCVLYGTRLIPTRWTKTGPRDKHPRKAKL